MGCLFVHPSTILNADPEVNFKSLPLPICLCILGFWIVYILKEPVSVREAVLPAYFCFLVKVFFSCGILELCSEFRYSVLLKVNIPVVGTDFSLKLLEIQTPFILINVTFSKERRNQSQIPALKL